MCVDLLFYNEIKRCTTAIKYSPFYPISPFKNANQSSDWVSYFVRWYNSAHLHNGIKFVTPNIRHSGRDVKTLKKRECVYQEARKKNPERWKNQPQNWKPIEKVFLNPSREEKLKKIA